MNAPRFLCPRTMMPHAAEVLAGCYDVPGLDIDGTVLDLGANVGAFTWWALSRWPKCGVVAFEPHPENAKVWRKNFNMLHSVHLDERAHPENAKVWRKNFNMLHSVHLDERAVYDATSRAPLYAGRNNCGEASLFLGDEQQPHGVEVQTLDAAELGRAQFLKIDTEGCERVILERYRHLDEVRGVALEWHSDGDRVAIARLLSAAGFTLVGDHAHRPDRGVQRWKRP